VRVLGHVELVYLRLEAMQFSQSSLYLVASELLRFLFLGTISHR